MPSFAQRSSESPEGEQYLTFSLAGEEYGLEILRVREIRGWLGATPIPGSAPYVVGVINLRGSLVTVMDLRRRLGLARCEYDRTSVVIVLEARSTSARGSVGLLVDAVSDVRRIASSELRPVSDLGSSGSEYLAGHLATLANDLILVLDVDRVVAQPAQTYLVDQRDPAESESAARGNSQET